MARIEQVFASINRIPCEASIIEKSPDDDSMVRGPDARACQAHEPRRQAGAIEYTVLVLAKPMNAGGRRAYKA